MKDETDVVREAMIKFEGAALEQANLCRHGDWPEWIAGGLYLAGRLCCALRASLPVNDLTDETKVQEIVEGLVQWPEFQEIWGKSTPRQKRYVRNVLGSKRGVDFEPL